MKKLKRYLFSKIIVTEYSFYQAKKHKEDLSKAKETISTLKSSKILELEMKVNLEYFQHLQIEEKDSEIEILQQMIRSLKTQIKVKVTDISRLQMKAKRLNESNDMRHDFIQSHLQHSIKMKKRGSDLNKSVVHETDNSVSLPPLNPHQSKKSMKVIAEGKNKTPKPKSRKQS